LLGALAVGIPPDMAAYVTPGMLLYSTAFAAGTVATAVDKVSGLVTVSTPAVRRSDYNIDPRYPIVIAEALTFAYDTGDYRNGATDGSLTPGFVRTFGNAVPVVLPWGKAYLDRFAPARYSLTFTEASPGRAQNALNSWSVKNLRTGPADFGPIMGFADLGTLAMVFFETGRMKLHNPRTGLTHSDEDYNLTSVSWTRGSCSPYAICHGSGWAIAMDGLGFYACGEGVGEAPFSGDIFDPGQPEGQRGQLEYAIKRSCIAAASGTDDYAIAAQVHAGILRVRYFKDEDSTTFDREIRYDFSASMGRVGPAALFRPDGSAYPWSTPLTLSVACSAEVVGAEGKVLYGAVDGNAGATDGRVDALDVGTQDNGADVMPVGYTGLTTDPGGPKAAVQYLLFVGRKRESGLSVAVCTDPELGPSEAEWLDLLLPTSGAGEYIRALLSFPDRARRERSALCYRISDDGSGDCPEISKLVPMTDLQALK
jgi:hypothetical protein